MDIRKEAFATAPVIESTTTPSGLTIVRLKRKRNEEPLDALVVQHFENGHSPEKKKVRRKASNLKVEAKENLKIKAEKVETKEPIPFIFRFAETVDEISFNDSNKTQQLKDRIVKLMNRKDTLRRKGIDIKQIREQQIARTNENRREERYKVIDRNRQKNGSFNISGDDVEDNDEAFTELFKMYDAVKESEAPIEPKFVEEDDIDSEIMCNFIPMVRQYLSLQEQIDKEGKPDLDDGYVYDIYYRDDAMDLDDQFNYNNIASLTWFNGDENEIFVNESDEKDEFVYSDEEDSNAEDYYTHDYPDEDEDEIWNVQEETSYESDSYF
ncbi:probable RNA polymerase II nuclear localization protein SLC7A6OS [Rhizophagus clarus]|uniref:Probable RNA polymerase II nuclear localization protein SLC7A6OS n=1 Tax=Rhizophagus clarus TaxID=94130 RepID=A0A8H3LL44_9GLOM|nr:probable RNA polymerase II nuclear localization protein SLC7A6OS [Rhizophagus clarus]